MALKIFVYTLLVFSGLFLIGDVQNKEEKQITNDIALLSFKNATMYTLTEDNISRVVYAKEVYRYKNRDIMYNAKIILTKAHTNITDVIKADVIIKKADKYHFMNNASFQRENYLFIESDEFLYDASKEIISNTIDYSGYYYNHTLKGKSFYFDNTSSIFKSKNVHFQLDSKNN